MTTNLPQHSLAVVSTPRSSHISSLLERAKQGPLSKVNLLDSIEASQEEKKTIGFIPKDRPELPCGQLKSQNPDYLAIIAEAFSKTFSSMQGSLITEIGSYTALQDLDQTMSQCVLQTTENSVAQEVKDMQTAQKIEAMQKQAASQAQTLNYIFLGFSIGMIVLTIASMLFTGGASAAALPEEVDMIEMTTIAEDGIPQTASTNSTSLTTAATNISQNTGLLTENSTNLQSTTEATTSNIESSLSNSLENTSDTQSNSITNNVSKTLENTSNKAADSNVKSISRIARVRQFLQSAGKRVVGAAIGAAFGAPSLLKGLADKAIASELNNLSQIQQDMGTAMAKAQENTAYFQFYQQLVQRFGSIVQEETSDASEVIETYADIVNAYRQIPYALANSV